MGRGNRNENVFVGATFNRLTVIERLPKYKKGLRTYYPVKCRCVCGNEIVTEPYNLSKGKTKSCGCWRAEDIGTRSKAAVREGEGYGKIKEGAVFGRLTVICRIEDEVAAGGKKRAQARCRCSCGAETVTKLDALIRGYVKSCGCYKSDVTTTRNKKTASREGFTASPETRLVYQTWSAIIGRCHSPTNSSYAQYGGKGITVCDGLRYDPQNLLDLLGLRPTPKHTIDRFPIHDGHYSCGKCQQCADSGKSLNVRWATRKQQSENRGDFNVYLTAFGRTLTRSQWEEESGINEETVRKRLRRGWSIEKALTVPDLFGNYYKPDGTV